MIALVVLMRFWQPAEDLVNPAPDVAAAAAAPAPLTGPAWKAWLPWMFLTGFVFLWGMNRGEGSAQRLVRAADPGARPAPRGAADAAGGAGADARKDDLQPEPRCPPPARALLLAGIASALCLGVGVRRALRIYGQTCAARPRVAADDLGDDGARFHHALRRHRHDDGPRHGAAPARCSRSSRRSSAGSASRSPAATPSSNVLFGNLQKVSAERWASRRC